MMDWILLSGFGTAALLLAELLDFIRDRWPLRPQLQPNSLPVGESAPTPQSARAPGAWQPAHGFAAQGPRWQTMARRLAGEWTVLDGVVFQHAYVHDAAADTETAMRRALSADQILSARINAAYAVWAAARSSQLYGE
jgi:hypothetical protein